MEVSILTNATKKSLWRSLLLFALVSSIYAFENFSPPEIRNNQMVTYIGKPVIWMFLVIAVASLPHAKPEGKFRLKGLLKWLSFIISCIYIFMMMLGGIIQGFGKSPYDHSFFGIIINMAYILTALAGREMVRGYLANNHKSKRHYLVITIVTLVMTFSNLPINALYNLDSRLDIVSYIGGTFLPELSNNILASYLVYLGGPVLSIIYLGLQQCFYWLFPILPNLNWVTKGMIGTLCPIFALMFLQYFYNGEARLVKNNRAEENPAGWVLTSIISIAIVWFSVGVFPIRPYVIVTGSMEPMIYAGDMVLIKTLAPEELKVGDVIQYKSNEVFIFHRVIDIVEDKRKGTLYQTKGDNNTIADLELVKPQDIYGKVIYTIPKIGWPTMLIKGKGGEDSEKFEY